MRFGLIGLVVAVVAVVIVALNALFIVNPTQQALVLQFGEVKQAISEPGLNTKIPLVQQVTFLDKRVLDLDVPAQEIIAADQKRLVVDAFMRWRIANPVRFYQTASTVQQGEQRLSTFVTSAVRTVLADATFTSIVRDDRAEIMRRIGERVAVPARDLGVEVVDVKIRRADLPDANSEAIFERMQTERQQEAREIRAQGDEAAARVRAAADRTATVLRAEAQRESDQIRGHGDAQRNAIFARAFQQDPDFFGFYRAMQAYQTGLASQDTRLVLSPDTDFFRYFSSPGQSAQPAAAPAGQGETGDDEVSGLPGGAAPDGTSTSSANATLVAPAAGVLRASPEASAVDPAVLDALPPVQAGTAADTASPLPAGAAATAVPGPGTATPGTGRPVEGGAVTIGEPDGATRTD
jgi:membrane protease subunit HflC